MLQENFYADEDQNDPAGDLCFCFEAGAKPVSDQDPGKGKEKRRNADNGNCFPDVHI